MWFGPGSPRRQRRRLTVLLGHPRTASFHCSLTALAASTAARHSRCRSGKSRFIGFRFRAVLCPSRNPHPAFCRCRCHRPRLPKDAAAWPARPAASARARSVSMPPTAAGSPGGQAAASAVSSSQGCHAEPKTSTGRGGGGRLMLPQYTQIGLGPSGAIIRRDHRTIHLLLLLSVRFVRPEIEWGRGIRHYGPGLNMSLVGASAGRHRDANSASLGHQRAGVSTVCGVLPADRCRLQ